MTSTAEGWALRDSHLRAASFGLKFPDATGGNIDQALNAVVTYEKPDGSPASPYRILDFDGYTNNISEAGPPVARNAAEEEWNIASGSSKNISWTKRTATQYQIGLEEIFDIEDYYPCIIVRTSNGTRWMKTLATQFKNTTSLSFPLTWGTNPFVSEGNYSCYIIAKEEYQENWTNQISGGSFKPLPFGDKSENVITLTVYDSRAQVTFSNFRFGASSSASNWTATVNVAGSATIEIYSIKVDGTLVTIPPVQARNGVITLTRTGVGRNVYDSLRIDTDCDVRRNGIKTTNFSPISAITTW